MSKSNYHHGNVEQALLEAAMLMLEADGAEALSLRKISKKIGVTPTAAYNYFVDKDALIVAIKVRAFTLFTGLIEGNIEAQHTAEQRIVGIGKAYLNFTLEHPAMAHLLWHVPVVESRITKEFIEVGLRGEAAIRQALHDLLVQHGIEPKEESVILATSLAWSQIHGLSTLVKSGAFDCCVKTGSWPQSFDFNNIEHANIHIERACNILISGILMHLQPI
jgi:AcrR family transcriptional regulator